MESSIRLNTMTQPTTWAESQIGEWLDAFVQGLDYEYVIAILGKFQTHDSSFEEMRQRGLAVSCHGIVESGSPYDNPYVVAYVFPVLSKDAGAQIRKVFEESPALRHMRLYQEGDVVKAFSKYPLIPNSGEKV